MTAVCIISYHELWSKEVSTCKTTHNSVHCKLCIVVCIHSYKEESADETDSDDIIESTAIREEDDGTEMIEKVLCRLTGKRGSK